MKELQDLLSKYQKELRLLRESDLSVNTARKEEAIALLQQVCNDIELKIRELSNEQ